MKKSYLVIVLFLFAFQAIVAQTNGVVSFDVPARNFLKFNKFLINPAFSFVKQEFPVINIYSKSQWTGFENSPQTYFLNYTGKFQENNAFGIGAFSQNYGLLSTTGGIINYARNVELEEDSYLTFGVNIGIYKSGLNTSKIASNTVDPLVAALSGNTILAINPGINYGNDMFDFGLTANNVVLYNFTDSKAIAQDPGKSFQVHAMYTGFVSSNGYFDESKFTTLFRAENKKAKTEFNANFMFEKPTLGWIQAGYNNIYGISAGAGANITKNISIGYNFGKGIGDISVLGNTHEFVLAYIFDQSGDTNDDNGVIYSKPIVTITPVVDPKIEQAKIKAAADLAAKIADDKAKAAASKLAYEKANAELKAKVAADAANKILADKAKADALKLANEKANSKTVSDASAKEEAKRLANEKVAETARLAAEKANFEATRIANNKALAKEKADADAKAKLDADKLKADAAKVANENATNDAKTRAAAEAKAKLEIDKLKAAAKIEADKFKLEADKAKAEATRVANEKMAADAQLKAASDKEKADALKAANAKLAADAKVKADADAKTKAEADKLKADAKSEADKAKAEASRIANEKLAADALLKAAGDKEKADALKAANAKLAADAKIKADADAKAKLEADKLKAEAKAEADKAKAEATRIANEKLAADAQLKAASDKEKADALKATNAKLAADAKIKADADAKAKLEADKLKADAKAEADKAKAEATRIANEKLAADAQLKATSDKEKADALKAANAKLAADAKIKADADSKAKLEADKLKADAKAEATRIANEKLAADAQLKATSDKEKADALKAANAKLAADAKIKADADAKAKLEADKLKADAKAEADKAKAEATKIANEKLAADAQLKAASDKEKADALKAANAKIAADAKIKADVEAKVKADAEAKAKADAIKKVEPKTESDKSLDYISNVLEDNKKITKSLLSRLDSTTVKRAKDLKDLKEENDLSDKGITKEPKPFQSASAANKVLENLKAELTQSSKTQSEFIKQYQEVLDERLTKIPSKTDPTNQKYIAIIDGLKADQLKTDLLKSNLITKLEQIKTDIDIEKKRRIKRASFESGQGRYEQDRAALKRIKETTAPTTVVLKSQDFDFGEVQENTQILKKIENTQNGYYMILAVHSDVAKRDLFISKVVSSGNQNIDFFFDVNTGKYYLFSRKYENLDEITTALQSKGNKPYNGKMFVVKIEN